MKGKRFCSIMLTLAIAITLALTGCGKPLWVTITAPADGTVVTSEQPVIEVRGHVSDAKAVVWVNDTPCPVSKNRYYSTGLDFTGLETGTYTINVVAAKGKPNQWKEVVARTVTVTYTPE